MTYTITSCAATGTNCPVGSVTTEIVALYTTICPVTADAAPASGSGSSDLDSGSSGSGSNKGASEFVNLGHGALRLAQASIPSPPPLFSPRLSR